MKVNANEALCIYCTSTNLFKTIQFSDVVGVQSRGMFEMRYLCFKSFFGIHLK